MAVKTMTLRRDDACITCAVPLPAGSKAQWDGSRKVTTCLACVDTTLSGSPAPSEPPIASPAPDLAASPDDGAAGASAQREYERRRDKRDDRVRTKHPRLGGLLLALSDEPQSTTAWAKGAVGERKLGEALDALRDQGMVVLHDRRRPGTTANIDHLVIGPSGIHVIDAKRYTGRVELRGSGSIFRPGPSLLFVNSRNQTKLVAAMAKQVESVHTALAPLGWPEVEPNVVRPALCFVDADWGWFAKPMHLSGVRISGPRSLIPMIQEPGPLSSDQIHDAATVLRERLPPA